MGFNKEISTEAEEIREKSHDFLYFDDITVITKS